MAIYIIAREGFEDEYYSNYKEAAREWRRLIKEDCQPEGLECRDAIELLEEKDRRIADLEDIVSRMQGYMNRLIEEGEDSYVNFPEIPLWALDPERAYRQWKKKYIDNLPDDMKDNAYWKGSKKVV